MCRTSLYNKRLIYAKSADESFEDGLNLEMECGLRCRYKFLILIQKEKGKRINNLRIVLKRDINITKSRYQKRKSKTRYQKLNHSEHKEFEARFYQITAISMGTVFIGQNFPYCSIYQYPPIDCTNLTLLSTTAFLPACNTNRLSSVLHKPSFPASQLLSNLGSGSSSRRDHFACFHRSDR
ncbi:hypothetical protein AVEN_133095-1 [Araneus ventricosus]|uniref:Uncharacterized protein n=1 Tax=Araneus ventricosus TaxID=182803 RepID=A0A4Y2WX39_ARAVE|nr:hypothetical protein AVEN_133095-1 [Araneus ventricosus]